MKDVLWLKPDILRLIMDVLKLKNGHFKAKKWTF
jgi:hypothetical protein